MNLQQLSLDTLSEVGGGSIREDFNSYLASLIDDCVSRPAVGKARKITITCELKPSPDEDGQCREVDLKVQVTGHSPARVTVSPSMEARKSRQGSMLVFDADGQGRIPFEE